MSEVACFWCERAPVAEERLRRHSEEPCPGGGWHDAAVVIGTVPWDDPASGGSGYDDLPHDDPRWPTACARCARPFLPTETWQHAVDQMYLRVGTGEILPMRMLPPGAMWDSWWLPAKWTGADGKHLTVKLPDGTDWVIDGPATDGSRPWARTGAIPNVSVFPSIRTPGYHGTLSGGVLRPVPGG